MAFVGDGPPPDAYHCSANSLIVDSSCPAMVLLPAWACAAQSAHQTRHGPYNNEEADR